MGKDRPVVYPYSSQRDKIETFPHSLFASSTKCRGGRLIILIILPAIICTHLKYFLHSAQKNQQGMLILNLQSLRKKIMRQKTKVHHTIFKCI